MVYHYHSIPYGQNEEHAAKLERGLKNLPSDFVAQLCYVCRGQGQYKQMYTAGCGGGYYSSMGECEYCERTGLLIENKPAPVSVMYQVLNAAGEATE